MNKVVIILLLLTTPFNGLSQKYKPIRAAFGLGLASNGLIIFFEPSIRITDRFSVGYRSEGGVYWGQPDIFYQLSSKGGVFQYYVMDKSIRLFVGVGMASYYYHHTNYSRADDPSFGFFPRLGYDVGHLTVSIDYNMINDFKTTKYPPQSVQTIQMYNRNYLSIRCGLVIGGGKKGEFKGPRLGL
jgi:hypothetical protein